MGVMSLCLAGLQISDNFKKYLSTFLFLLRLYNCICRDLRCSIIRLRNCVCFFIFHFQSGLINLNLQQSLSVKKEYKIILTNVSLFIKELQSSFPYNMTGLLIFHNLSYVDASSSKFSNTK